jgi:formate/nitrite transporter FocA (FNT family)
METSAADKDVEAQKSNSFSAVEKLPELSVRERDAVDNQSRPNAALIHETIRAEGESELDRTVSALLLSGLAAGLSMGLSLLVQGLLQARLPEAPWRELVSYLGYTVGFLVVVLGRQQLFTENTLTPILPLLRNRDAGTLWRVLRLWSVVLAANLAATWAFAAVVAHTEVFEPDVHRAFAEISRHGLASPFGTTFLKAVFAGWLIALMVWLLPAAEAARPVVILIVTYVVALGQFSHIIAGSVDVLYLVETGEAGWSDFLTRFFVPTLLGNVAGGVALVAALNYGQVAPELGTERG